MTDYQRLTRDEAKALEEFFAARDRLAELNLESATLRACGKLVSARLPNVSKERPAGRTLRATLADRWNSAGNIHRGVVSAGVRTMRRLIRARGAAGFDPS